MAEKTKLKWLRNEFSSSEELEYYLTQLKHQDKLKSDIIALLERFQHLLFQDYDPDFLTITYDGEWDVSFGPTTVEDPKQKLETSLNDLASEFLKEETNNLEINKKTAKTLEITTKPTKLDSKFFDKEEKKNKTAIGKIFAKEESKNKASKISKEDKRTRKPKQHKVNERIDLMDLLNTRLLSPGTKLKHKTQSNVVGLVTREGKLKVGKEEYKSLSGAATSLASSGRRDGWLCWLFQDEDGEWKTIDLLRERFKEAK